MPRIYTLIFCIFICKLRGIILASTSFDGPATTDVALAALAAEAGLLDPEPEKDMISDTGDEKLNLIQVNDIKTTSEITMETDVVANIGLFGGSSKYVKLGLKGGSNHICPCSQPYIYMRELRINCINNPSKYQIESNHGSKVNIALNGNDFQSEYCDGDILLSDNNLNSVHYIIQPQNLDSHNRREVTCNYGYISLILNVVSFKLLRCARKTDIVSLTPMNEENEISFAIMTGLYLQSIFSQIIQHYISVIQWQDKKPRCCIQIEVSVFFN